MIHIEKNVPENVIAFRATGKVTADDFRTVLLPAVNTFMKNRYELNYMLYLDTDIDRFTMGAWLQDIFLGLKQFCNWKRSVIITEDEKVEKFTHIFSRFAPGEYRAFRHEEEQIAKDWVSGKMEMANACMEEN